MCSKKEIRKELLRKRNTLTEEDCKKYSKLIENQLLSLESYIKANVLLVYASYQKEVSTYGIIEHALQTGKRVFCPKVLHPGIMEFYEIFSLDDITFGYKNIPEPPLTNPIFQNTLTKPFMLMPLVGFDANKNRLGYGGGFYDRYLQRFSAMERMGLAFECQKFEPLIPTEETDIRPHYIITEQRIY